MSAQLYPHIMAYSATTGCLLTYQLHHGYSESSLTKPKWPWKRGVLSGLNFFFFTALFCRETVPVCFISQRLICFDQYWQDWASIKFRQDFPDATFARPVHHVGQQEQGLHATQENLTEFCPFLGLHNYYSQVFAKPVYHAGGGQPLEVDKQC